LTLVVLVTSVALVAGLAWASRRLPGLPVGALRALIAGLLGFAAAEAFGRALQPVQSGRGVAAFFTVALGVPLIVAMIFIVVAEALVPTGTGPRPVEVVRGLRRALARSRRYSQISRIAVRHGLGPYLRGRRLRGADAAGGRAALAVSLRRALEESGVTFTKLGQLLSTRRDLLPPEFISELARLQDRAESARWEQVEELIGESLRVPRPGRGRRGGREGTAPRDPRDRRTRPGHRAADGGPARGSRPLGACGRRGGPSQRVRRRHARGARLPGGGTQHGGHRCHLAGSAARRLGQRLGGASRRTPGDLCTEHVLVTEWLDGSIWAQRGN